MRDVPRLETCGVTLIRTGVESSGRPGPAGYGSGTHSLGSLARLKNRTTLYIYAAGLIDGLTEFQVRPGTEVDGLRTRGLWASAVLAIAMAAILLAASPAPAATGDYVSQGQEVQFSFAAGDDTLPYIFVAPGYVPVTVWKDPDGVFRLSQISFSGAQKDGSVLSDLPSDRSRAVDGLPDRVAMDASGDLHFVWDDGAGGVWHKAYDSGGNVLSVNHLLSGVDSVASSPAVAAAMEGGDAAVWVAWVETREGMGTHVRLVSVDPDGAVLTSRLVDGYGADLGPTACDVFVGLDGLPQVTFLGAQGAYWALPPETGGALVAVHAGSGSLPVVMDGGEAGLWAVWRHSGSIKTAGRSGNALGPERELIASDLAPSLPRATDLATLSATGVGAVLVANGSIQCIAADRGADPAIYKYLTPLASPSDPMTAIDYRQQSYAVWTDGRNGGLDCFFRVLNRESDVELIPPVFLKDGQPLLVKHDGSIDVQFQVRSLVGYDAPVYLSIQSGHPPLFTAEILSPSSLVLEHGATAAVTVRFTAGTYSTGQWHDFQLIAEPAGWTGVFDEIYLRVEVPTGVPFLLRGPDMPVTALPGEPVTFPLRVESLSGTDSDIVLSIDVPSGWTAETPATVHLPAGATVDVPVELRAPASMPAGTTIDFAASGTTTDGARGTGTVVGAVVAAHKGVAVTLSSGSLLILPGQTTTVEGRVVNTGNLPLELDLTASMECPGWTGAVEPSSVTLTPGSEAPVLVRVSAPAGAVHLSGCTITVAASVAGSPPLGVALLRAMADRLVSYDIEAFPSPSPVYEGESHLTVRATNAGNAPEDLYVEILGLPLGWSASAPDLARPFTLAPGAALSAKLTVYAPDDAPPGAVSFALILHGSREVVTIACELEVPTYFSVELQAPAPVVTLTPPGSVSFPLSLVARGNLGGEVRLSAEGVLPGWDFSFKAGSGVVTVTFPVGVREIVAATLTLRVPEDASAESVAITVLCKDTRGLVLSRVSVYVRLRFPDLTITDPTLSSPTLRAGTPVTLRVLVQNIGGADAEDVVVLLKDGDRVLDREQITLVPQGGWRDAVFYVVPEEGTRTLYVQVDPAARIPELIRYNNLLAVPIDVAPKAKAPLVTPTVAVASVTLIATCSIIGLLGGTEVGRYALLAGLLIPLYTKLMKDRVLDHYLRGKIHGYIIANPGEHYNAIKEQLDVTNGALSYHLRVLEREGYIRSRMDGMYKRFYPSEMKLPRSTHRISSFQEVILTIVKNNHGVSQKDIARRIGVSSQVINYHIKLLEDAGLIQVDRTRRKSRVYATDTPAGVVDTTE